MRDYLAENHGMCEIANIFFNNNKGSVQNGLYMPSEPYYEVRQVFVAVISGVTHPGFQQILE